MTIAPHTDRLAHLRKTPDHIFQSNTSDRHSVLFKQISDFYKGSGTNDYSIECRLKNSESCVFNYSSPESRDEDFQRLVRQVEEYHDEFGGELKGSQPKSDLVKGSPIIESVKSFYKKHEKVLFPLLIVVVLDHFFNDGRIRERITEFVQRLLDTVQKKLLPEGEKHD